ncbi:transposase, partial [Pseudomonas syringae pv. actinidiae]|nr:transposase [Pseudomonas syringae pv. actinidiae]NAS78299.1 transposase [Pseudomonas syringae pv. actinidiae]NAT01168.1 transposase [Pseudomonas syringae pv. actinidiae]NAT31872.1 transposase [Pseudomonas syringae pv. actinidiae]NAT40765.1 transposase [Pseudomonas syringae pv. actinidiae]
MAAVNEGLISSRRYRVGATVIGADGRSYVIGTINTKARQVVLIGQLGESHVYQDDDFRNTVASGDLRSVLRIETPCGVEEVFEPRVLSPTEIKSSVPSQ